MINTTFQLFLEYQSLIPITLWSIIVQKQQSFFIDVETATKLTDKQNTHKDKRLHWISHMTLLCAYDNGINDAFLYITTLKLNNINNFHNFNNFTAWLP